jgi:hypothetical protein
LQMRSSCFASSAVKSRKEALFAATWCCCSNVSAKYC